MILIIDLNMKKERQTHQETARQFHGLKILKKRSNFQG